MLPSKPSQNSNSSRFPFEICNLLLGKGGSGQVFLGRISGTDEYVAIKKRYAKADINTSKVNAAVQKDTVAAMCPQVPRIQGTQSALSSAFSTRSAITFDTRSMCCTDCAGIEQLSQRREFDLGKESLSQMTALLQQTSKPLLDVNSDGTVAMSSKPHLLTDEVSILQYLGPHPQIVKFMGNCTTSKYTSYFTMELMDSDVARELKESNVSFTSEDTCVATAYSVLKALEYLHGHGVAHRDVKPGNILLKRLTSSEDWPCMHFPSLGDKMDVTTANDSGTVLYVKAALGDFSAAHSIPITDDSAFADTRGTLHYKSPEQLMGRRGTVLENLTAVDMWALGCTMYEMITGARPFPGSSELQVLMNVLDLMGSDIQSFPLKTGTCRLFQSLPVSSALLDLLKQLMNLDAPARPTAKKALQHPVFAALREAEAQFERSLSLSGSQSKLYLVGIPLVLKYASFTHIPQLHFSRISRAPLVASLRQPDPQSSGGAPSFTCVTSEALAEGGVTALSALTHCAQRGQAPLHKSLNAVNASVGISRCPPVTEVRNDEREATVVGTEGVQHCSPDTTMISFMSDGSYLHWSEIRPVGQPHIFTVSQPHRGTHHPTDNNSLDHSAGSRVMGLLVPNTGNTPSPLTSYVQPQQHQFSESSRHPSASMYHNTVARALNVSDSSFKVARTERSTSHVDFDLSPVAARQLLSADADFSVSVVPHAAVATISRPPLPVLQLKSGSTFTASNLRANAIFERDGDNLAMAATRTFAGNAMSSNSFSTPRENVLLRTTACAGRALCFSEETDRFARGSTGSCPSQHSCLNSLLTSPAPLSRVHEGSSPHPSPILPLGVAVRSPSGVPLVERSGLSSDDSVVGLGWMRLDLDTGAASTTPADASVSAATAVLPSANAADGDEEAPLHLTAPILTAARSDPQFSSGASPAKAFLKSPHKYRCVHRSVAQDSKKLLASPITSGTVGNQARLNTCVDQGGSAHRRNSSGNDDTASTVRVMPLPIPLSVAAVAQTRASSREPSASASSSSSARAPASRQLHRTPNKRGFPPVARTSVAVSPSPSWTSPSTQRRSMSATVAVKSTSPEQARRDVIHTQVLQSYDINVASFLMHRMGEQQECGATSMLDTPSASPQKHFTVPLYLAAAAAASMRSQRHCTPSSAEPPREASAVRDCDVHPLYTTQSSSAVLFAEAPLLQSMGSTDNVLQAPSSSVVFGTTQGQVSCCEGLSTASPRGGGRNSYKRSREELTSREGREPSCKCLLHF